MSDRDLMTAVVCGWDEQHCRGMLPRLHPSLATPRVGVGKGQGIHMANTITPG